MASPELQVALAGAHAAGGLLLELFHAGVETEEKGDRDLVSVADRDAERLVREHIAAVFPNDLVVGEEGEVVSRADAAGRRRWYVDPLDGTTNFLKGRRWWGVSIGFCDADDRMRAGVVHLPCWDETYAAEHGAGATRNGEPVRCSSVATLREALVTTGFPGATGTANVPAWERAMRRALSVRATGALAPDLCAVASGRSDGVWALRPGPWDIAAGMLVASEAGATVTDLDGAPASAPPPTLLAAAPGVHAELLALVNGTSLD